jgi:hypothetical protein
MSSPNPLTERELAQAFFTGLVLDPAAQPAPALPPATVRLIRELVAAEQAASRIDGPDFAAARRRIRRNIRPPLGREGAPVERERDFLRPSGWAENEPVAGPPPREIVWPRFAALAGMAATIALVVGLLVLSLVAVRAPGLTPTAGVNPASRPTVAATLAPSPTPTLPPEVGPTATVGPNNLNSDLLNPKRFLPQALTDLARDFSLDPAALDKQIQGGMSLAEIAKQNNLDLNQVKKALLTSFQLQIEAEKNSGQLTPAQADELSKQSGGFIDEFLAAKFSPPIEKVTATPAK